MSQILAITLPLPVLLALVALLLVALAMGAVVLVLGQPAQVRAPLRKSMRESGGAAMPPVSGVPGSASTAVKPER